MTRRVGFHTDQGANGLHFHKCPKIQTVCLCEGVEEAVRGLCENWKATLSAWSPCVVTCCSLLGP